MLESGDLQSSHLTAYDRFHRIATLDERIACLTRPNDDHYCCFCFAGVMGVVVLCNDKSELSVNMRCILTRSPCGQLS